MIKLNNKEGTKFRVEHIENVILDVIFIVDLITEIAAKLYHLLGEGRTALLRMG